MSYKIFELVRSIFSFNLEMFFLTEQAESKPSIIKDRNALSHLNGQINIPRLLKKGFLNVKHFWSMAKSILY